MEPSNTKPRSAYSRKLAESPTLLKKHKEGLKVFKNATKEAVEDIEASTRFTGKDILRFPIL